MTNVEAKVIEDLRRDLANGWVVSDFYVIKGAGDLEGGDEINIQMTKGLSVQELWYPSRNAYFLLEAAKVCNVDLDDLK